MAETKGFEPLVALTTQPFQDCTLSRSDKSPMPTYNTKVLETCQIILHIILYWKQREIEVHIVDSDIIQLYAYIGWKQYFPDIEKRPIIKTDRFV